MKKKPVIAALMASAAAFMLAACAEITRTSDKTLISGEEAGAAPTCVEGCQCYAQTAPETDAVQIPDKAEVSPVQTQTKAEEDIEENAAAPVQTQNTDNKKDNDSDSGGMLAKLTEGELAARRQQQANFAKARDTLYSLPASLDKTERINDMDRQILANNAYDFGSKTIVFIGDSITEGITSSIDQNGNYVSYVTYANSYLHFGNVLNHGLGGRMFSTYGGDELSLSANFGNVTNINSDIIVVFAGVNDYLCVTANKRFGSVEDTLTTGSYCGSVRYFMSQLKQYYSDNEIFFVTMYDINRTSNSSYIDYTGQPTLGDFMEAEKKLAKEFGFKVIDLYGTGFMDCSAKEASDYFLRDGLHPKDSGSIYLGEHIAAEISLYFSQRKGS